MTFYSIVKQPVIDFRSQNQTWVVSRLTQTSSADSAWHRSHDSNL